MIHPLDIGPDALAVALIESLHAPKTCHECRKSYTGDGEPPRFGGDARFCSIACRNYAEYCDYSERPVEDEPVDETEEVEE